MSQSFSLRRLTLACAVLLAGAAHAADLVWLAVGGCGAAYALWAVADSIRNRDVSTQREVSTGRTADAPASAPKDPNQDNSAYGLAPGFVTPYGYPLPPYADGNNFQTIYTGR